jgi:hypothetical protein
MQQWQGAGIKNWAKAIFVSPSIFYASHVVYAERIIPNSDRYAVLIEARVKPDSCTARKSTVVNYGGKNGETNNVEYRVQVDDKNDVFIYRVFKENNVIIKSISFVKVQFLENVKDFCEGDIVVNSKEERMLLED